MKTIVFRTKERLSERFAYEVARQLEEKPETKLGIAAGGTMKAPLEVLVRLYRERTLDFSGATTFTVDEYVGLPIDDPASVTARLRSQLFNHIDIKRSSTHFPNGRAIDLQAACKAYEEEIVEANGIDLLLLGIGINGHLGFNEPNTSFSTYTHVAEISIESRSARLDVFGSLDKVPSRGITMGIRTLMNARRIILLVTGEPKAEIVRRAILGLVSESVPASVLQLHPDCSVLLDSSAASLLPSGV